MVEIVTERQESLSIPVSRLRRGNRDRARTGRGCHAASFDGGSRPSRLRSSSMFFQDRQNTSIEMRLQSGFIAKVLLLYERLDSGVLFPVLVCDFIAANV